MESQAPLFFEDRVEWRRWLQRNHHKESEVWILTFKMHTGRRCLSYPDALEEALCWGWIDSRVRRIDDERHMMRFAPRKPGSIWSLRNRRTAQRLIEERKMTAHGLAKIAAARKSGEWDKAIAPSMPPRIPSDLKAALVKNPPAWENFQGFAKSYKTQYIYWIITAKRPETRRKRIAEVMSRARRNKKMYMP